MKRGQTPLIAATINNMFTVHVRHMVVSKNGGTPKSSILTGFSIINHPFWGTSIFGNPHIVDGRNPAPVGQLVGS